MLHSIINDIFSGFIMIITPIIFSKIVLEEDKKVSTSKSVIIVIMSMILCYLSKKYLPGLANTLAYILIYTALISFLYGVKFNKTFLLMLLYSVLLMLPDVIVCVVSIDILKLDSNYFYNFFAGTTLANFLVCALLIGITWLIRKPLRKLMKYKLETNVRIVLYSLLSLICTLIFFYYAFTNLQMNNQTYISVGVILIFLCVLFSLYNQKIQNNKVQHRYEKLLEYMKQYEEEIEKQRILRHENKNQISSIKSLAVDSNASIGLMKYLNSLLQDNKNPFNKEKYARFQYFPANGIKALFYFKTDEAEERGINVSISISPRVADSCLSKLSENDFKDLGKIIGVYMDNAIEASQLSSEKILGIESYLNSKDNVVIIISNSYSGSIDAESLGKSIYSTKGKNRGHGLLLVNKIVEKNQRLEIKTEIDNKIYVQKLIIKKPTKK